MMEDSIANISCGISGVQVIRKNDQGTSYIRPFQVVFFRSDYLTPFSQIANGLVSVEIRNCGLVDVEFLSPCIHLRYLSLADNNIGEVPQCIADLGQLQMLDLSRNVIADYIDIMGLQKASPNLLYVSFAGNRVTSLPNYRKTVIKVAPNIIAIDSHVVSDEEVPSSYCHTRGSAYSACSRRALIHESVRACVRCETEATLDRQISRKVAAIMRLRLANSPAYTIQCALRRWFRYVRIKKYFHVISKLQARVRNFLHHCRLHRELALLMEEIDCLQQREEFESKVDGLTPFAVTIQRSWRAHKRRRQAYCSAIIIQKWYRDVSIVHRGICLWMKRNHISGLALASSYVAVTRLYLEVMARRATPRIAYEITQAIQRIQPLRHVRGVRAARVDNQRGRLHCLVCPTGYRADVSASTSNSEMLSEEMEQASEGSSLSLSLQPPQCVVKPMHRNPAIALFRAMPYPWICYAFPEEKRRLNSLRSRGNRVLKQPAGLSYGEAALGSQTAFPETPFWKRSSRIVILPIEDHSVLWKVYKRLVQVTSKGDVDNGLVSVSIPLFFNHIVVMESSAVELQRIWRGYLSRKVRSRSLVKVQIRRRAVILLQRWWKFQTYLKRRLALLSDINRTCRDIHSAVLYLDAWVYYKLMRCFQPPPYQKVMHGFTEYGGIPVFNKQGRIVMQPISTYRREERLPPANPRSLLGDSQGRGGGDKEVRIPSVGYLRYCIPQWASWRPSTQLTPLHHLPSSCTYHQLIADLISVNCEVCVVHFPVWLNDSTNSAEAIQGNEIRVVQITFSSIHEAQVRCAMLMLQTYDPTSHTSIPLMTREIVLQR